MSHLFTDMAGISADTFTIGGVSFMAAPVALDEYAEYLALPAGESIPAVAARAEWLATKLRRRVHGKDIDPIIITTEWLMKNLSLPRMPVLQHILLYGELPGGEKKA